jgi:Icc protein
MSRFSFIHISDHHLGTSDTDNPYGYPAAQTFRTVMGSISRYILTHTAENIDFIVSTGDIVNTSNDEAYQFLINMLNLHLGSQPPGPLYLQYEDLCNFPMYLLPGNHDQRDTFSRNLFPRSRPAPLVNAIFLHNDIHFICIDWGAEDKARLYPETYQFLRRALQETGPFVLFMHHNIVPLGTPWLDRFIADDVERFYELLAKKNVLGIFCGHLHSTYERWLMGIPVYGLRSTAFQFKFQGKPVMVMQPPHYRVVTIEGEQLTTQIVEVPLDGIS